MSKTEFKSKDLKDRVAALETPQGFTVTPHNNITINSSSCLKFGSLIKISILFTPNAGVNAFESLFKLSKRPNRYASTSLYNRTDNSVSGLIYLNNGMDEIQCTSGVSKDKVYAFELII